MFTNENRGQVGIGTLIVFIAMVLVAAIAAGVLVNTAGMLQETAEQTGQESQAQVSDRLQVVTAYGTVAQGSLVSEVFTAGTDVGDTDYVVREYNFVLMKSAGSDAIDLDRATLSWIGPDGAEQMLIDGVDDTRVTQEVIQGDTGSSVLDEQSDRIRVTITEVSPSDGAGLDVLAPGEEATVRLTTESGASVVVELVVPTTVDETDGAIIQF